MVRIARGRYRAGFVQLALLLAMALTARADVLENRNMPLEVTFTCPQNLVIQQSPLCALTIKNKGNAPVSFLHPQFNKNSPIMRIMELKTGAEVLQQKGPRPSGEM